MGDSSDEDRKSRGDGTTHDTFNVFNVKSTYEIGQDATIPCASNAVGTADDIKFENTSFYEMVCTTMKKIESERKCETATETGKKRPNTNRTSAVPRKKSHDCVIGKLNQGGDLKSAKPRRKERRNPKKRDRTISSESESSSQSDSPR